MFRHRQVATLAMILSLALMLVGCGGSSDAESPQTGEAEPQVQEQEAQGDEAAAEEADEEAQESQQTAEASKALGVVVVATGETDADDLGLVTGEWGSKSADTVDAVANLFIDDEVSMAVVPPEQAAALYNATGGSLIAVDAVTDDAGVVRTVSVASMRLFGQSPDQVVAYVARHGELVTASLGEGRLLTGSAMQRALTEAISDAYVASPSSVGGALPPDNFYFLG